MRTVTTLALLFVVALGAQAQAPGGDARREPPRRERAPLASPEDLEPAVDVSEPRVAIIDRNEAAAAAAAAAASARAAGQAAPGAATAPSSTTGPGGASGGASQTEGTTSSARTTSQGSAAPQTSTPRVLDSLDLGTTSITGNQELPKVLYIVPWKKSDLGDLVGRPVNTLLDEVLTPVDPEVFERHLEYYETLHGKGLEE
jgi:hypothetical protein